MPTDRVPTMRASRSAIAGLLAGLLTAACGEGFIDTGGNGNGAPGNGSANGNGGNGEPNGPDDPPRIVFQDRADGPWRLHTVGLDGSDPAVLDPTGHGIEPAAAAGTVVFASTREGAPALYAIPAGGGAVTRITGGDAEHGQPALSPDGTRLAYVRVDGGIPKIYVSAADGSGARRLTTGLGGSGTVEASPSFSPDGSRIVLSATPDATPDLFIADVETGAVTPLLTGAPRYVEPAFSPDGGFVAFAAGDGGAGAGLDIHVLDLDDGSILRLTERDATDAQPAWLDDGRLVYTAATDEGTALFLLDPADLSEPVPVAAGEGRARHPAVLR